MGLGSGTSRSINFGAGPAKLPTEVLEEVQNEILSYLSSGMSLMEMSHRSKEYAKINKDAQDAVRELLNVPPNYKILFIQGGGTGAFAAIALNLINRTGTADYCVTGTWSGKAAKEAIKYGEVKLAFPVPKTLGNIPDQSTWNLNPNASYVYYCANETVDGKQQVNTNLNAMENFAGVQFHFVPETYGIPLVTDMSSSIMTQEIDVSKFGCIFGGAQKNIGPSGVTVVIIRDDLLGNPMKICPTVFDFTHVDKENSIHNTPATFSSVGGMRASLYNAVTYEEVEILVNYMKEFKEKYEHPVEH
ncbi:hypothetical protein FQA39_LY13664 [Lamprigera yunnana]|nr:hypothetical protein FQA39_LY13664 [Lamprigera yunnana]